MLAEASILVVLVFLLPYLNAFSIDTAHPPQCIVKTASSSGVLNVSVFLVQQTAPKRPDNNYPTAHARR